MPVPPTLAAQLRASAFWAEYCFDDRHRPDVDDDVLADIEGLHLRVHTGVTDGLDLEFLPRTSTYNLALIPPSGDSPTDIVGWSDEAHFAPDVLCWDELDLVCRAASLRDPSMRHPGATVALLSHFTILAADDEVDLGGAVVGSAFDVLRPPDLAQGAYWPTVRDWLAVNDRRLSAVSWERTVEGDIVPTQPSDAPGALLYSIRSAEPGSEFPFERWRAMLASAEEVLADVARRAQDCGPAVTTALQQCLEVATAEDLVDAANVLAEALRASGYEDDAVLRALAEPVHRLETVWVVESIAALPRGALFRRVLGLRPPRPVQTFLVRFCVSVAHRSPDTGGRVMDILDSALSVSGLGSVALSSEPHDCAGSTHDSDTASFTVFVRDDLDRAQQMIDQILRSRGLRRVCDFSTP